MAAPSMQDILKQRTADLKRREYARLRDKGYGASTAWAIMKARDKARAFPWKEGQGNVEKRARLTRDGFTVDVKVVWDSDPDTYDNGRFSDTWAPGAVLSASTQRDRYQPCKSYAMASNGRRCLVRKPRRLEPRKNTRYPGRAYFRGEHYTYWIPEESAQQLARYYNGHREGMAKHVAYLKALEQIRDQEKNTAGDTLSWYGVEVTVSILGEELSSASCYSIGIDDDDHYLTEVAEDLIHEALHEARDLAPHTIQVLRSKIDAIEAVTGA